MRKRMKKLIAMLSASAMLVASFAGCGQTAAESDTKEASTQAEIQTEEASTILYDRHGYLCKERNRVGDPDLYFNGDHRSTGVYRSAEKDRRILGMRFEVRNGSFGYKNRKILNDISFSIEDGEILSVLGSNGVGKTTLLKCMMGLLHWEKGGTYIDDVELSQIRHKEVWQKIAYVPQAKGSTFGFSVLDMVMFGRSAHLGTFSQPTKEDREIAEQALEDLGITYLKDKICSEMSGGELQMVLIARALTIHPNMLVLDEPESNLDFKNQLIILETIEKLAREKNISAIVNTHYPDHALKISNKALILNRDGTNFYGNAAEVINEPNMEKLKKGKEEREDHEGSNVCRRTCMRKDSRDHEGSAESKRAGHPCCGHEAGLYFK